MFTCYQGNSSDCGFASLKMLLANKSKNKSYLFISKPVKKKEYTFSDIMRIARSYGFVLSAYSMPREDIKEIEKDSLALINEKHLVYIKRVGKKRIIYFDPAIGKVSVSHKKFKQIWTGYVIECVNTLDARPITNEKPKISSIWVEMFHYLIVGVIFASLMIGFYLIKDDSSIILTMGFLLLFAIAELVENWYIIKQLKLFDKRFMDKFFSRKCNQNLAKYKTYVDYRSNYFIVFKVLISNLIVITVFSALLCINDYRNVFAFLILLLIKALDINLSGKSDKDNIKNIDEAESSAFESGSQCLTKIKKANDLANRFALKVSLKKVIYLFICVCLALAMMVVSGVISTNFMIFHFGIYFLMSEAFDGIIRYFASSKDRKIKKAQFLDDCDL